MSITLTEFGTLVLPLVEAVQDIGAIGTHTAYVNLPGGGAYDSYGTTQAPRGLYTLMAHGELADTTQAGMLTQFDALRAWRGKRDKLYALVDDTSERWVYARLRNIAMARSPEHVLHLPVDLQFDVLGPVWNGTVHSDVFPLTGGGATNNLTVTNDGNADVVAVTMTITAPPASTVTNLNINVLSLSAPWQAALEYNGTIAATESLIIDGGTQGIYNDSLPDYANLEFNVAHTLGGWLRLAPGDNSVQVTYTGSNGASLTVAFYDAWE